MQVVNKQNPFTKLLPLLCIFSLLLNCKTGVAQNKAPIQWFNFDLLSQDTIWKYQNGIARPEYYKPGFDDAHWQTVNNQFLNNLSRESSIWPGTGVFRKTFIVPDSLKDVPMELLVNQYGAMDIYLDGNLVSRFGKVSANGKEEHVFVRNKLIPVSLDSQSSHVLGIYYSNHNKQSIVDLFGSKGFYIILSPVNPAFSDPEKSYPHALISGCIILSFCVFFCFLYWFYPYRLASLISVLYIANFSGIFISGIIAERTTNLTYILYTVDLWRFAYTCNPLWGVLFLYAMYYNRLPRRSWIIAGLMIVAVWLSIFSPLGSNIIWLLGLVMVPQLEAWRIIILGIRKKKTGFWVLATGWFISLMGGLFVIFDVFNFFPPYLTVTQNVLAVICDLSFPFTMALQFAWEFGSANRDLRKQLVQVNALSQKTIAQEQEKQQLLSTQNETLERQVVQRTSALNKSLEELRATQAQLIQSEKMASLGELTAGIAHEIQNPLNFVNNFSEVNTELVMEMKDAVGKGDMEELRLIIADFEENEQKINLHGRRADSIVKGMLEHSRSSKGEKQPTDVNTLCDEYVRLSYHGMRAKDKQFNATIKTDFDESIEKIRVVPQDIGRVFLNLFNNAFYAVNERQKQQDEGYEPTVFVSTKRENDNVLITVKDNGMGISKSVQDKIFQPFFTTKPTGQGTGLGLSLSYDIIKAHGGALKVESEEGQYAAFIVQLPLV